MPPINFIAINMVVNGCQGADHLMFGMQFSELQHGTGMVHVAKFIS